MKFPNIYEVATTDVVKVDVSATLNDAIDTMHEYNHRNVVVESVKQYYILTASDILGFKLQGIDFSTTLNKFELTPMCKINKNDNILDTIEFLENTIEYFCAVNDDESLYGILTHTDIISNIDPETLMENYRIGDLINMSKNIYNVGEDCPTNQVLEQMSRKGSDCVIVQKQNQPIGIVTTKDIMDLLKNNKDLELCIRNYMSSPVETLNGNASIKEAISFMKEKHFKRIIVTNDEGKLIGLILQKELIALSYSKWSLLMKEYFDELAQINTLLQKKNLKYEKMASTDALTGLYNRYKFTELYVSEYNTMVKRSNSMSLMILDIDNFKSINDTYGHNVGDKVLLRVSNLLLKFLRNVDIVGRWGGEEFVALLPTANLENAVILANKIRKGIQSEQILEDRVVTASFGVTQIIIGDELIDAIRRADDALYEAKKDGKNIVKTA